MIRQEPVIDSEVSDAGFLSGLAFIGAVILSFALLLLGLEKFQFILAGGKKFATFPNLDLQLWVGGSYLILQLLYLFWLLGVPERLPSLQFKQVFQKAFSFLLLGWISYPLGNDIYLYLHFGLMNLKGLNPFVDRAGSFFSQLYPFVDWGQTSTYGPISQALFSFAALSVPWHPILGVYVFKTICLSLHLLNGYLIWRLLFRFPDRSKLVLAYLINPMLLMEQVGSAHVDILVATSFIMLLGTLAQQRYLSSFWMLWAGLLSKTIPLLWFPLVGIFLMRQQRWRQILAGLLLSLVLVVILSLTVFPSLSAWHSLLNPGVAGSTQASLHRLVYTLLEYVRQSSPLMTRHIAAEMLASFTRYTLVTFAIGYAWIALRALTKAEYSQADLTEDIGWVLLIVFLIASPWIVPWYASILLTIAVFIPHARLFGLTSLMFSLSSSSMYLFHGHETIKSLVTVGLPLATWVLGALVITIIDARTTQSTTPVVRGIGMAGDQSS